MFWKLTLSLTIYLNPPPPHQPTPASPCTPAKLTHAATIQTPMPPSHSNSSSHSSYSSFTSIAANVDPLIFDFSNIDTPTTNTAVKAVPTKRSKPVDLSESPTKRVRSSDRISTARNPLKMTSSVTLTKNAARDVFNDDQATFVCPQSMTASPYLTTALADQGNRSCIGLRPLIFECSVPKKHNPMHDSSVRRGRVCHADVLYRKLSCRSATFKSTPSFLFWLAVIIVLFSCINVASASSTPAASLSFYAINTNGFVHPTKIDATNRAISHRNPDIFVVTETKTNSSCSSKMNVSEYQLFEERGTPTTGHHLYKWGAILGIKKSIAVSQRLQISHPSLKGRIIAVDVIIPLESGIGFTHRIIAAYAPWNVSDWWLPLL